MFGTNENKDTVLLFFGKNGEISTGFYPKIHRQNKNFITYEPALPLENILQNAEKWVKDKMTEYQKVVVSGEGFGSMIANLIAHKLHLRALLFNPLTDIDGHDFPFNNPYATEIILNKGKKLLIKSPFPEDWLPNTQEPELPDNWDIHTLSDEEKYNQEIMDWAITEVCDDGWAWVDDAVWSGED